MSRSSEYLMSLYNQRKIKNPRYSQRAFAKTLGINPGRVTQYFDGERSITKSAASRIAAKLDLDEAQKDYFLHLISVDEKEKSGDRFRVIAEDELAMIVEWYHSALLSLVNTVSFQYDFDWMARRLGLPVAMVKSSWERLERMGFLKIQDNKVILDPAPTTTQSDIPSKFLRLSHQDSLRHIIDNLEAIPVENRDLSSITLAVDAKKLPKAKEMIRVFRRRLANYLSQGKKTRVYTINVQLFPLTKD